jgi:hypothetical protein
MIVPGVAGPPLTIGGAKHFDAFVFSPLPYRTAVYGSGATHVLALRTRPNGAPVSCEPGLYERRIAPAWFRKHGMGEVADWYQRGGQQFR